MVKFTIRGRLDGLNDYTKACRSNAFVGNKMKNKNQRKIMLDIALYDTPKIKEYPVKISIKWYEKNRRRDIDNITFATKFILDSLVKMKILVDDSQKYVTKIEHKILIDKNFPRIEVEIRKENE